VIADVLPRAQRTSKVAADQILRLTLAWAKDDGNAVACEQALCPRAHPTGDNQVYAPLSQPPGQQARLMRGGLHSFGSQDLPALLIRIDESKLLTSAEMTATATAPDWNPDPHG